MKRLVCILLVLMLLLASCGKSTADTSTNSNAEEKTSATTATVAASTTPTSDKPSDEPIDEPIDEPSNGENANVDILQCLVTLLSEYSLNPASALPESMVVSSQSHLIDPSNIINDYSHNVNIANIPQNGFGEQWNMVAENIYESQELFNTLSVIEGLTTISVAGFNNYLDTKPTEETAHYEFESGIYSVTIKCTEETIYYVLDYQLEVPELEAQSIQLALSMDMRTYVKKARIQIGDIASLAYAFDDNSYAFALDITGIRKSYFEITQDNSDNYSGHIYEYLNLGDTEISASVADFYITEDYVTVVGNKAGGLIGFDGYICELYSTASGKMLGYEVRETFSVEDADAITYNTLWFNLESVNGINSIKYIVVDEDPIEYAFFVNGSSREWTAKKYGISGGLKFASRRFDIEFRTQYCYSYDEDSDTYTKHAIRVPMLFVQEEVLSSVVADVRESNDINISITLSELSIAKIKQEYSEKTDLLIENKDNYSTEIVTDFIGDLVVFN